MQRGLELLGVVRDMCRAKPVHRGVTLPFIDTYVAREKARRGDLDGAIAVSAEPSMTCFRKGSSHTPFRPPMFGGDAAGPRCRWRLR